jgi:Arc/MetJ-type ribon-helix-helix transcriptional regulator
MATPARLNRQKISTTIAPETLAYLERLINAGRAATLAEAIDVAVQRLRAAENRQRLERDTATYFDQMSEEELAEEQRLGSALATSSRGLDFDREP